jgi:hypothetical protein
MLVVEISLLSTFLWAQFLTQLSFEEDKLKISQPYLSLM